MRKPYVNTSHHHNLNNRLYQENRQFGSKFQMPCYIVEIRDKFIH